MKTLPLFRATSGLDTKADPVRLRYDKDSGVSDLATGLNVSIDDTGRPRRRPGQTATDRTEACHSLFCHDGENAFFVAGATLYQLGEDFSRVQIQTGLTAGARVDFCQVDATLEGPVIFWANGWERGKIAEGAHENWTASSYVGQPTTDVFTIPDGLHHLAHYRGRLYGSHRELGVVWYSEQLAYSMFNMADNYLPFSHRVRMLRPVDQGIFIGTDQRTFFCNGSDPKEGFEIRTVANYPPVEWSDVPVDAKHVRSMEQIGAAALWMSPEGICYGGPDGRFFNLTEEKIGLLEALEGAGIFHDGQYIGLLKP